MTIPVNTVRKKNANTEKSSIERNIQILKMDGLVKRVNRIGPSRSLRCPSSTYALIEHAKHVTKFSMLIPTARAKRDHRSRRPARALPRGSGTHAWRSWTHCPSCHFHRRTKTRRQRFHGKLIAICAVVVIQRRCTYHRTETRVCAYLV